jgi:spore coat protein H
MRLRSAIAAVLVTHCLLVPASAEEADDAATRTLFEAGTVLRLQLQLEPAAAESLRREPETYVACRLVEQDGTAHPDVAIKLKGGYGSMQSLDDRPALTLNMDKYAKSRRFHGLDKFHLNNSVQDESLLRELLGSEIFRAAGIPTPRVAHARVWLDGRDLGLYVFKEGFDREFLRRLCADAGGNLYDGGLLQEIDSGLERDEGKRGPPGRDLDRLVAACRLPPGPDRWQAVEEVLAVEPFLTFAALELMTGHWDGYCLSRNNYRLHADPADGGRFHFLPHGMDQIFGDAHAGILDPPHGLVALAVMDNPEWRRRFRERVRELLPLFAADERLVPLVDRVAARLQPALRELGPAAVETHAERVTELRDVLRGRQSYLEAQAEVPEPPLWCTAFDAFVRQFNADDDERHPQAIPNAEAADFLRDNIPWFECPDPDIERTYYFRWWAFRKHILHTEDGRLVTDTLPTDAPREERPEPSPFCGHHLREARWLRDAGIVNEYSAACAKRLAAAVDDPPVAAAAESATCIAITGLAERLDDPAQEAVRRTDFMAALGRYTRSHATAKERFTTHNRSTYGDLIVTGVAGLRPRGDETVEVYPLAPEDWPYFALHRIPYRGHLMTILWDATGMRYGRGAGLRVFVDDEEIATADSLTRIAVPIQPPR